MKKLLLSIIAIALFSVVSQAQDYKTAIGIRGGYPANGLTVKQFMNEKNALEGILATSYNGFVVTALYENEHWTGHYPGLNWFWGFGAHVGFWGDDNNYNRTDNYVGAVIGADFILGIEYTFDEIPLNLSLDLIPSINLIGHSGFGGLYSGLSIRYAF